MYEFVTFNINIFLQELWVSHFNRIPETYELEVYSIQLYVIKFVKDLRQGPSFSTGTLVFSTNKTEYEWNRQCDDMFPPPTKLSHEI
jgi:hypothetical protein